MANLNYCRSLLNGAMEKKLAMSAMIAVTAVNSLFNRILMTKFFFDYPIVILTSQMALTLVFIEVGRLLNIFSIPGYTFQRGRQLFVPSVFITISSYLNLNCLDGTTMPVFPFIQRFAPIVMIALMTYGMRRDSLRKADITMISVICIGSAFASLYEWSLDLWSISYGLVAMLMHSVALLYIESLSDSFSSPIELAYLNSFNCLCLFLVADLLQDEMRDSFMYILTSTTWLFLLCLGALIGLGALFYIILMYNISRVGAVHSGTMIAVGNGIQVFVAYGLSVYLFYDLAPTWTNIFAILICIFTALHYYLKTEPTFHLGNNLEKSISTKA